MRIVIVEDNQILLDGLNLLLTGEEDISVTGAYRTAEDALSELKESDPDIMLVDIGLPGMSGIELIKKVKNTNPYIDIMAYTIFDDKETVFSAIKSGASGYILKGSTYEEVVNAIRNLYSGGAPMSPKIAKLVIMELQNKNTPQQYLLTQREREILSNIEKGLSYKDISAKLNISWHTVHTHIKNIYEKLHAKNRGDAIIKAKKKGII